MPRLKVSIVREKKSFDDLRYFKEKTKEFEENQALAKKQSGFFSDDQRLEIKKMLNNSKIKISKAFPDFLILLALAMGIFVFALPALAVETINCVDVEGGFNCETTIGENLQDVLYWVYQSVLLFLAFLLVFVVMIFILKIFK